MAEEDGQGDRTEAASARRLQRAREEGNVPVSRELAPLAVLIGACLMLVVAAPEAARGLAQRLTVFFEQAHALDPVAALRAAALDVAVAAAPFVLMALVAGAAAVVLQTGPMFNFSVALPDFSRLDPRRGLRRILGTQGLIEVGKSALKVGVVAWVAWNMLSSALPGLGATIGLDPLGLSAAIARQVVRLAGAMLAAQAVIVILDLVLTRIRYARSLRMSRHELHEEHKEAEGDPKIKARIRQIRLARARKRMMSAVPKATVVITNPTHYAVALAYDQAAGGAAPKVVAKGVDELAQRIRAVAEQHRVPVIASPPLARALYTTELDTEIPTEHFKAVAEIIAYVWRMRGKIVAERARRAG
jgi:flagellar biosynthetic protein FlhB